MGLEVSEPAQVLRLVADQTRLKILLALAGGECGLLALCGQTELPRARLSDHLATLRSAGLVRARREGRWVYYRLGDRARAAGPGCLEVKSPGVVVQVAAPVHAVDPASGSGDCAVG